MGEDEDAAGARRLDEAHRGDGLAGAGRVLEPEALVRVRVLGAPRRCSSSASGVGVVVERLLVLGDLLVDATSSPRRRSPRRRASSSSSSSASSDAAACDVAGRAAAAGAGSAVRRRRRCRSPPRCASASSAVSVPESASTWCGLSCVPSASLRLVVGEHALEAEHERELAPPLRSTGAWRPPRARRARRRARGGAAPPGASASAGSSPGRTKGSRANFSARESSLLIGKGSGRRRPLAWAQPCWLGQCRQRWPRSGEWLGSRPGTPRRRSGARRSSPTGLR